MGAEKEKLKQARNKTDGPNFSGDSKSVFRGWIQVGNGVDGKIFILQDKQVRPRRGEKGRQIRKRKRDEVTGGK